METTPAGGAVGRCWLRSAAVGFDWAAVVEREGAALAEAVAARPTAPVPAAPGWDATELLRHVGTGYARAGVVLRAGTMERPSPENGMVAVAPADGVVAWFREALARLVGELGAIGDPDRPVYAFAPGHRRAGFWPRRMAHETTVHRVDAEQAVASPVGPIAPDFAVDGVEEVLTVFVPTLSAGRSPGDGGTVHLHATDAEGEWLVRFDPGDVVIARGHAKGDAAVRGPAGELLLWLWGRRSLDELDVVGERSAAEALRSLTTF
jgi:uncharacterized protein (TIGR03083 family)